MSMESSDIVIDRSPWLDLPVDLQNVLWGWVCVGDKDEFIRFLSKHKPNYTEEQSKDAFGIALSLRHPKPSTLGTPNTSTPINQKAQPQNGSKNLVNTQSWLGLGYFLFGNTSKKKKE
eukprot:1071324_1